MAHTRASENILLATLAASDRALLAPHLVEVPLELRHVMAPANRPIEHVYFPLYGIASVVATAGDGTRLEVGLFGRDGMSAPSLLLGVDQTPQETFVQVEGVGLRMEAARFTEALGQSNSLQTLLLKFVQAFTVQSAHTAVSNGTYKIEERLARWLLMCHDRVDTDDLALTHDFLAIMLGVRRSGVTLAIQTLEGAGMIKGERGRVLIRNRAALETVANGSYGVPEAEYERLIAPLRRRSGRGSA